MRRRAIRITRGVCASLVAVIIGLTSFVLRAQAPMVPASPPRVGVIGAPGGTGPMPAVAEAVTSLPNHTIYRPATMPAGRLPLVLWGNGACSDEGLGFAQFLREIASYGYVVIALGAPGVEPSVQPQAGPGPGRARGGAPAPPPPATPTVDPTQYTQHFESIDWAERQTGLADSPFAGRIDTARIAVLGHSCGGLQAIAASADPRVTTTIVMNSGVNNAGPASGRSSIQVSKDQLLKLHGPVAYVSGGPTDVAQANAEDDVRRIEHVPVFWAYDRSGHGGTYRQANGGTYAQVARAWLDWQLKGDATAAREFVGPACGLCTNAGWTVTQKRLR